jgi:hypothetical protein
VYSSANVASPAAKRPSRTLRIRGSPGRSFTGPAARAVPSSTLPTLRRDASYV